jgi:hypothetical protein
MPPADGITVRRKSRALFQHHRSKAERLAARIFRPDYFPRPVQTVTGEDARDVNDPKAAEEARAELMRIGRRQWPRLTEQDAYERAFCDPRNATMVARLYQRPTPTTIYPMPREWLAGDGSQHAKADRGSSEASAYDALMVKAEEYRNAHPELSISQCFEKVFTAPANRELAKRERIESAPR